MYASFNENDYPVLITALPHEGGELITPDDPRLLGMIKTNAKAKIDNAAGAARRRFVSPGDLLSAEYELAEKEAQGFADGGYAGDVPASVQSHVDSLGGTATEAADDIIATGALWRTVLNGVRSIRLSGKAAVDAATTKSEVENALTIALSALEDLTP